MAVYVEEFSLKLIGRRVQQLSLISVLQDEDSDYITPSSSSCTLCGHVLDRTRD